MSAGRRRLCGCSRFPLGPLAPSSARSLLNVVFADARLRSPDLDSQPDNQLREQGGRLEVLWEAGDGQFWKLREEIAQPSLIFEWKRGSDTILEVGGGGE